MAPGQAQTEGRSGQMHEKMQGFDLLLDTHSEVEKDGLGLDVLTESCELAEPMGF